MLKRWKWKTRGKNGVETDKEGKQEKVEVLGKLVRPKHKKIIMRKRSRMRKSK